jgi:hypothetical protein
VILFFIKRDCREGGVGWGADVGRFAVTTTYSSSTNMAVNHRQPCQRVVHSALCVGEPTVQRQGTKLDLAKGAAAITGRSPYGVLHCTMAAHVSCCRAAAAGGWGGGTRIGTRCTNSYESGRRCCTPGCCTDTQMRLLGIQKQSRVPVRSHGQREWFSITML